MAPPPRPHPFVSPKPHPKAPEKPGKSETPARKNPKNPSHQEEKPGFSRKLASPQPARPTAMPTFTETLRIIEQAKMLHSKTDDVMFKEAIKILTPLLAEDAENPSLTMQQQTALTYVSRSLDQFHGLYGYPSEVGQ